MLPAFNSNQKGATSKGTGGLPVYNPSVVPPVVEKKITSDVDKLANEIVPPTETPNIFQRYSDWTNTTSSKLASKIEPAIGNFGLQISDIWKGGISAVKDYSKMNEEEKTIFKGDTADLLIKGFEAFGKGTYDFLKQQVPTTVANTALMAAENPNAIKSVLSPLFKGPTGMSPFGNDINKGIDTILNTNKGKEIRSKVKGWADNVLVGLGEMQKDRMDELGITDQSSIFEPANFGYQLSSGASSMAAAIGVTYITKNPALAGAMLGWLEGSGTYTTSKEKLKAEHPEWSDDKINSKSLANATIDSAGIAVLEKVGLDFLFRSYGGGKLFKAAVSSITESLQESSQTAWSNAVAKYGYDKTRSIFDDVAETFIITMPIGFFGGGAIGEGEADTQNLTESAQPQGGGPKDDPAYIQSLEKAAKENGITVEEAGQIADVVIPEINKAVASMGETLAEQQRGLSALSSDVSEAIKTKGEDKVIQDMIDNPNVPVKTREEAKSAIDTTLEMFTSQNDEVMSAIKAAEESVNQSVNEQKTKQTEIKKETSAKEETGKNTIETPDVAENIQEAQDDWENNYAEQVQKIQEEADAIQKQIKETKDKIEKSKLQKQLDKLNAQEAKIENEFVEKWQPEQMRQAVEETFTDATTRKDDITTPEGVAKDMIRGYVERGDTLQSLKLGQMGVYTDVYGASIGGYMDGKNIGSDFIKVERIGKKEVNVKVSLRKTYDAIKAELSTSKVAASKKESIIEANGKGNDNNNGTGNKDQGLPDNSGEVSKSAKRNRGRSRVGSESMAPREGDTSLAGVGERLSPSIIEEDIADRIEATGLESSDIQTIIQHRTQKMADGTIIMAGPASEEELEAVSKFVPAGGQEKKGAEGRGLLDEYYTPGDVSSAVASILDTLNVYRDGMTILEPSVGTGNFLGDVPMNAAVDAYEINETAARIAKMSYPEANIVNAPFESIFMGERGEKKQIKSKYDLVLGNPPYGEHRGKYKGLGEEPKIAKYEEYFLKRALDLTKEGGHVAFVMPSGFMRSGVSVAKEAIYQKGTLVEGYRLPNGTFDTTDIGTDILVFRKNGPADLKTIGPIVNDQYFKENPDRVLGTATTQKGKFGMEPVVKGSLEDAMDLFYSQIDKKLGEDIVSSKPSYTYNNETTSFINSSLDNAVNYYKEHYSYPNIRGLENYVESNVGNFSKEDIVKRFEELYPGLLNEGEKALKAVGQEAEDSYKPEVYKETRKGKADVAIEEVKKPIERPISARAEKGDLLDLAIYSTADYVEKDLWQYVSATGELEGNFDKEKAYFENGKYYNSFNYLQGDIYAKLDQLEKDKSSMDKDRYENQKKELERVLPERVGVDRMNVAPSARFVTEFYLTEEDRTANKSLADKFTDWVDDLPRSATGEASSYAIKQYVRNIPVRGGDKLQNEKERKTRRIEGDRLFKLFLKDELSKEDQAKVEEEYNRKFNSYARPDYRNVPLVGKISSKFHGHPLDIKDVQLQGVGFLVNKGVGLLAHDVGVGKTMQAILAVNESLNRGWSKKPLVVVPSVSVYNQWANEINELIPGAKLNFLANLGGDFKGDLKTLSIPDGSISLITEEGFKRLGFSDETYADLTKDFQDVIEAPGDSTKRAQAKGQAKAEEEVGKGMKGTKTDRFFEDLGFDLIVGDEIHNANHIIAKAKMEDGSGKVSEFRGFQTRPSLFGIKMWLATQYILKKNNNRNVFLLSATPFTNNPLEYYSILSLMARERMRRMGILNVNDFMTMFMEISSEHEFRADGSFKEKNEVRSFKNYQQFQKLLTEFIDFRDGEEAGVVRPKRLGKEYTVGETEMSMKFKDAAQALFKDKDAGTLKAINELRSIAFSPYYSRYYTGALPTPAEFVEGSPKLKATVELIKQSLKDKPDAGHLIYSTIGVEYFPVLKEHLVKELGLKESEVDIISGATAKEKRVVIQENFNQGKVKVVLGSDAIQEGVNLQRNSTDLYILSLPWNFTALRQVTGRIWRQGNRWPQIRVNSMFTENSIDIFLSQKLQNKEKRYEEAQKFKGDVLDVADIDFEEMKHDLITDPVARATLEFEMKEKELDHEIATIKSERAYRNRKAEDYMNKLDRLNYYKEALSELPKDANDSTKEYYQGAIKNMEENIKEEAATLKSRGFDMENLQKDIAATDAKITELENKKETLTAEKEKALEKAKKERKTNMEARETDFEAMVTERREENQTFYGAGPLFDTITEPAFSKKPVLDIPEIGITDKEREAFMAYFAQGGRITEDIKPLVDSAIKKWNDYMAEAQNEANKALFEVDADALSLDRSANDAGVPFNMTEFDANSFMNVLFGKDVALIFSKEMLEAERDGKLEAWGKYQPKKSWRNPLIRLVTSNGMVQSSTLFHEAFHAFLDNQVSEEEKNVLLKKVENNFATLPARLMDKAGGYRMEETAEEWLAEDFVKYVAKQEHMTANDKVYSSWVEKIRGWVRKTTGAEMVYNKILANQIFQERRKITTTRFTFTTKAEKLADGKAVLEEYKKRFNLDFDVDFANTILTPQGMEARGVTYNNKITLTENLTETTAHHEFTHLVATNLDKIPAFAGITETALLKAINGGRDYTVNEAGFLHEELASGFEDFVKQRPGKKARVVERFYQKLKDLLIALYKSFGGELNIIQDFYQRLATAKGGEKVVLESDRLLDAEVRRFDTNGDLMLDFNIQARRAEFDSMRRSQFDEIENSLPFGDQSENLIKKDINSLYNWTAQARDIYLKDPNEFGAAKVFEQIGDTRRMKKTALDLKFSKILEPYNKIKGGERERVNAVLMEGDKKAVEYDEADLKLKGLSTSEIAAYNGVRKAFNIGHELLLAEMATKGVPIEEIEEYRRTRVGYMPHKWPHKFVVKTQELKKENGESRWTTTEMSSYKTEKQAKEAWEQMKLATAGDDNKRYLLDKLGNLDVDFFSQQGLSFEALKSVVNQARTGEDIKAKMLEAVRNMFKEKGFGRNYMLRTGVRGYESKEIPEIIAQYFAGLDGFITKMEAAKKYYDVLSTVDARRQNTFYNWLRDSISYDLGQTKEFAIAKRIAFIGYLANDLSFLLVNATQNFQVGMGELSKYIKGGILKPERVMMKAMTDYWTGNITPDEKEVVDGLVSLGALGGEQIAEMVNVKNNPLYSEISSRFNKALYSSTSFVERAVNRVPAFLAARRILIEQGMGPKEANEKALEISDDIHFRYGKNHRPRFMRGGLGVLFTFNHYARSMLYQLSRDLSNREFKSFARKMTYTVALGGTASLPFASLLVMIFKMIFKANGDDDGEEEMGKLEQVIKYGLPAGLTGVDLSNRVGLEFLGVNSIIEAPLEVKSYMGVVGSIGERLFQGGDLMLQGRYADALGKLLPDFLGNPIKAYTGYKWGVRSFAGTPLEDANGDVYKYNSWEAIIKATGFSPIREKLLWNAKSNQWASDDAAQAERTDLRRKIQFMVQRGQYDEARALQAQAQKDEIISEKTDYVREFGKKDFFGQALEDIKNGVSIKTVEKELIQSIYGEDATDAQKNIARKDLAIYRTFGTKNKVVNELMRTATNDDKVKVLKKAKEELGEAAVNEIIHKGRKSVATFAGNSSPMLISDDLLKLYNASKND